MEEKKTTGSRRAPIVESHLFSFSNNPKLNRMAVKCILNADNSFHGEPFGNYLPPNIKNTEYSYTEFRTGNETRGRVQAVYLEPHEDVTDVYMFFEFNETMLLNITNSLYD